jgi:glycine/D-amino acid oxidase-like deaminating enzyme
VNVILGQGIAGSVLALEMISRGEEVIVIDDGHGSSSSMVAAGLWNPIVFRRINKSWLAEELVDSLDHFYQAAEVLLQTKFYHSIPIWRIHSSQLEKDLWADKMKTREFEPFLTSSDHLSSYRFPEFPFGDGLVLRSGFIDVPMFLDAVKRYLLLNGSYLPGRVELSDTVEGLSSWKVNGKVPDRIIDCRGYKTAQTNWFGYLPFGLTKGEVLTVCCPGLDVDKVFNSGFFLLPLGDDTYRLGATFNWDQTDEHPTEAAREELLRKFRKWVDLPVEVVDQRAGVRPTVVDRRPLIGRHPVAEKLYIFNGLGTKGVMIAPFMARQFCDFLAGTGSIHPEADINRFIKFFK